VDRHPIPAERRRFYEASIRVLDLVVYAAITAGGVWALVATPSVVVDEIGRFPWLIVVWAALLFCGGLIGFIGRLFRRWMIENPATVAAFTGVVIFLVLILRFSFTSTAAFVATTMVLVAGAAMVRRWLELQIFGSEPGLTFRGRFIAAAGRRTPDLPHRHR
jgi:hypothetical protein